MALTWQEGLALGGGVAAAGAGGYLLYRYLAPRLATAKAPTPPTNLRVVTNTAVSAKNAALAVAADTNVVSAAGGPQLLVKWYHYYPNAQGKLVPKLIGTTTNSMGFTFGVTRKNGVLIDGVTPGRPYTWGVQVCLSGACSTIAQYTAQAAAFTGAAS